MVASGKKPFIVITYSLAGLGHLRVARALAAALPPGHDFAVLPGSESILSRAHGVMSNNPVLRNLFEFLQKCGPEVVINGLLRSLVRATSRQAKDELISLVKKQAALPSELAIVCTHFMLAEQLTYQKSALSRALNIPVKIYLQVTDDTVQNIWYIPGVDRLVVPSPHVANHFKNYAATHHLPEIPISVCPYPVSPLLTTTLTPDELSVRRAQYEGRGVLSLLAPLSGATVGLDYLAELAVSLQDQSVHFTFVGQASPRLKSLERLPVELLKAETAEGAVTAYDTYYREHVVGAEITKPSEQAFKALIPTDRVGGSILLFARPVGLQEYENFRYLEHYHFIPTLPVHRELYDLAKTHTSLPAKFPSLAAPWRGLRLPTDPALAATFIAWARTSGLLSLMGTEVPTAPELSSDGAKLFWQHIL